MKKVPHPLTDLERQKGFNIRKTTDSEKSTRELKPTEEWKARNTRGNPKKKK